MYNISTALKAEIDNFVIPDITATVNGTSGSITITSADIAENSLSIDRKSVSNDKIEIGSAVTSELKMTLYNADGKFNSFKFEGAEMYIRAAYKIGSRTEYIPLGYFTIDNQPRKLDYIELTAYDRMVKFSKVYDSTLGYPASLWVILDDCCSKCGVSLSTLKSTLTNADYLVQTCPQKEGLTYWQVLQWIAELTGTCAWIDWDGKLRLTWYTNTTAKIAPADRYSSDLQENDITITGVQIVENNEEGTTYRSGAEGYMFNVSGNLLAQSNLQSIANALGAKLTGFKYRPYTATAKLMPHLWQMDKITFTDLQGVNHTSIITNHTFKLDGRSTLAAKGESAQRNGYAKNPPFTARQEQILSAIRGQNKKDLETAKDEMNNNINNKLTEQEQSILSLNEVMVNATGLYPTVITNPDGSETMYLHDKPNIAESSYICTRNAGGYAWTNDGWNNSKPIWQYGTDKEGNAIYRAITAHKLWADLIVAGRLQSKDGSSFWDLDNGLMQLTGTFTAKATSDIDGFGSSATLRGFNAVFDADGNIISGGAAGLAMYDSNGKQYGVFSGASLGAFRQVSMLAYNEAGDDTVAQISATKDGSTFIADKTGVGDIYHTGNLLIKSGIAMIYPTANGNLYSGTAVIDLNGLFSNAAVPVVTANTANAYGCIASCSKVENGSFTIYLTRSDNSYGTSVSWMVTEVKVN